MGTTVDDGFTAKALATFEAINSQMVLLRADLNVIRKKAEGNQLNFVALSATVDGIDSALRDLRSLVNENTSTTDVAVLRAQLKRLQSDAGESRQNRWSLLHSVLAAILALIGGFALWKFTQ